MRFSECLREQIKMHPSCRAQDIVKLCYQAAFGAEHMLTADDARIEAYLRSEFDTIESSEAPLYEWISPDVARINLAAWKARNMPVEWLLRIFTLPRTPIDDAEGKFNGYIAEARSVISEGGVSFSPTDFDAYMVEYRAQGLHAVHHTDEYRAHEHPAYRIACREAINALPILERAASHVFDGKGAYVIALDGRAASGKSTLGGILCVILSSYPIHMDDFFLPPELRTESRLSEPGGNVHYERFSEEVLPYVKCATPFEYRRFDCSQMALGGMRPIPDGQYRIIEGSYSLHPVFGKYYDLSVFCDITPEHQYARVLKRNGERMARVFASKWIPLEEKYFDTFGIRSRADIVIRTDV